MKEKNRQALKLLCFYVSLLWWVIPLRRERRVSLLCKAFRSVLTGSSLCNSTRWVILGVRQPQGGFCIMIDETFVGKGRKEKCQSWFAASLKQITWEMLLLLLNHRCLKYICVMQKNWILLYMDYFYSAVLCKRNPSEKNVRIHVFFSLVYMIFFCIDFCKCKTF